MLFAGLCIACIKPPNQLSRFRGHPTSPRPSFLLLYDVPTHPQNRLAHVQLKSVANDSPKARARPNLASG